ncbi:type II toxin-antitoxin system RelE/ParE family toxin [Alysiella crassa]|uniref:Phage-related protein n=1 Tax=Alysiella crassa TaxID=153491 RepID=A0A376BK56_9NEIS|nr:type II toxin-antitoxin system RelE/ParE family toxin [Alysiella crassa]UOP07639.1 type II toxin-antitoxin system RelE/ParE family toxin [Alysiella crassa]SSY70132.1 Phage-related protein [Alysiella crassa]
MKEITFLGNSLDCIREFPNEIRQQSGYELHKVQNGEMPTDFKPMPTIGRGVMEIRLRDENGAFRIIYTAKIENMIYVLHAFQKKTQRTSQQDLNLAKQRLNEIKQG